MSEMDHNIHANSRCNLYQRPLLEGHNIMTPDDIFPESPLGEHTAMDPTLNQTLWMLPDARIWADVHCLRAKDASVKRQIYLIYLKLLDK